MTMAGVMIPSVHLNGDTREELRRINLAAYRAAQTLIDALCEAAPNGRNWYVQGPDAINKATAQHRSRVMRAEGIKAELEDIVYGLLAD
jgi:hypothetical protein